MPCTREHTLYRNTNKIKFIFIMWLQYYAHSDWALLSFNDQELLARCPRHMQSVFNLMVDILKAAPTPLLWSIKNCQKGYLLTSVT